MRIVNLDNVQKELLYSSSSKGNLPKWRVKDKWYKTDGFGYESLCEVLISRLGKANDILDMVEYIPVKILLDGKAYMGCESDNFLERDERMLTLEKMHRAFTGRGMSDALSKIHSAEDSMKYCVDFVANKTRMDNFGKYMAALLQNDAFFLNEDRHFNNIAVIYNEEEDTYRLCPVFDNGLSLCSALDTYPITEDIFRLIDSVKAKPFDRDYLAQVETADKLYGCDMKYTFSKNDIIAGLGELSEYYDERTTDRVKDILFEQMRKWSYLFA